MKLTIFKKIALSLAVIEFIYNTLHALAQFYAYVKLIFQVLPDGAFASFCFIGHILECIVRHLCHFI